MGVYPLPNHAHKVFGAFLSQSLSNQNENSYTSILNRGFGNITVILHNWAKNIPNMGVAAPQAPVIGWGPGFLKSLFTGSRLLVNCYLENNFHNQQFNFKLKQFNFKSNPNSEVL